MIVTLIVLDLSLRRWRGLLNYKVHMSRTGVQERRITQLRLYWLGSFWVSEQVIVRVLWRSSMNYFYLFLTHLGLALTGSSDNRIIPFISSRNIIIFTFNNRCQDVEKLTWQNDQLPCNRTDIGGVGSIATCQDFIFRDCQLSNVWNSCDILWHFLSTL